MINVLKAVGLYLMKQSLTQAGAESKRTIGGKINAGNTKTIANRARIIIHPPVCK